MSETQIREWQKTLKLFDPAVVVDGDFGFKSLSVSLKLAEKAGIVKPPPVVEPGKFSVKDHILYMGNDPVNWQASEMVGGEIDPLYIVVHYTGTLSDSLGWLTTPWHENPVSANFLIQRTGQIWQLAECNTETWHAGKCNYAGITDWNGCSIGIECQGTGKDWPEVQTKALIGVISALLSAYPAIRGVIGHQHIAWPRGRKPDPGPNFDWDRIPKAMV